MLPETISRQKKELKMKTKILLLVLILICLLFVYSCKDEQPVVSGDELPGLYISSTFIEPGSLDGGIDIIACGGYIELTLKDNFEYSAEMFIPENIYSNHAPGTRQYEGTYALKSDTLKLSHSISFAQNFKWSKQERRLESFGVYLRGPFKLILDK